MGWRRIRGRGGGIMQKERGGWNDWWVRWSWMEGCMNKMGSEVWRRENSVIYEWRNVGRAKENRVKQGRVFFLLRFMRFLSFRIFPSSGLFRIRSSKVKSIPVRIYILPTASFSFNPAASVGNARCCLHPVRLISIVSIFSPMLCFGFSSSLVILTLLLQRLNFP